MEARNEDTQQALVHVATNGDEDKGIQITGESQVWGDWTA
jgi:hypothetical protein